MRKIIMSGLFAIAVVGIAVAADRDRHAAYSDPKAAAGAQALCKGFYGSDDNLSACNDFCGQWKTANEGSTCDCDDGKCATDDH
jgi:hypothetical protein